MAEISAEPVSFGEWSTTVLAGDDSLSPERKATYYYLPSPTEARASQRREPLWGPEP